MGLEVADTVCVLDTLHVRVRFYGLLSGPYANNGQRHTRHQNFDWVCSGRGPVFFARWHGAG